MCVYVCIYKITLRGPYFSPIFYFSFRFSVFLKISFLLLLDAYHGCVQDYISLAGLSVTPV